MLGSNAKGQTAALSGTFEQISSGYNHVCARKSDGRVQCWGANDGGGTSAPLTETFSDISCGLGFVAKLPEATENNVTCWGKNDQGQATPPEGMFKSVSAAGDRHACGILTDDTISCWGQNDNGETDAPEGAFTQVSAAHKYNCALDAAGAVTCWGKNDYGQGTPPAGVTFLTLTPPRYTVVV